MKHIIECPRPPISPEREIAHWRREVFRPSRAWEQKMALLDEIHGEISHQLHDLISSSDDAFSTETIDDYES